MKPAVRRIVDFVRRHRRFLVSGHVRSDGDALGGPTGLRMHSAIAWIGVLLLAQAHASPSDLRSFQEGATDPEAVLRDILAKGAPYPGASWTNGKSVYFTYGRLATVVKNADLPKLLIDILSSRDVSWAERPYGISGEDLRFMVMEGGFIVLAEYSRQYNDRRGVEYLKRVALDKSEHWQVRRLALGEMPLDSSPEWPGFLATVLHNDPGIGAPIISRLYGTLGRKGFARPDQVYTEEIRTGLLNYRNYLTSIPYSSNRIAGVDKLIKELDAAVSAGPKPEVPPRKVPAEEENAAPPKTGSDDAAGSEPAPFGLSAAIVLATLALAAGLIILTIRRARG